MTNIPEENLEQMPVSVQCTGNILMIKDPCVEDRVCSAFPQGHFCVGNAFCAVSPPGHFCVGNAFCAVSPPGGSRGGQTVPILGIQRAECLGNPAENVMVLC